MTILSTTPEAVVAPQTMLDDVVAGLSQRQKTLPSKYFYDVRGSKLFDDICELDEYYVARVESTLMAEHVHEIASAIGPEVLLIEYGSGSSLKTRLLLRNLDRPVGYVPIDISSDYLSQVGLALQVEFPKIEIMPVAVDFTRAFDVPNPCRPEMKRVVYFPGSTIGNFQRKEAQSLLAGMADLAGGNGGVLIGIDLDKDRDVLHAAYNDSEGVTAQFNLNMLRRINRELGANFDLQSFRHEAIFDSDASCIEMHLVSTRRQTANVCNYSFEFQENETILTEYSHKYTFRSFEQMANEAGLVVKRSWTDANNMFAVLYLARG
ncbi:MAG: L-histidine N(alpha)-methyltransferase [Chloroflexi bacterium]|nr:L-histidine N(alpha)-methyltransferase [Chloroflexota bacterium]